MDKLIDLNIYGTTCHMRLWADKLVVMQSDSDYRKLITVMAKNINPLFDVEDKMKLARLRDALDARKTYTDKLTLRQMKKSDINGCRRQILKRIQITDEVMRRNGHFEIWEKIV